MTQPLRRAFLAAALLAAAPALPAPSGPYEVKSGVYESTVMGGKEVVYFDDFGRKQARFSTYAAVPGHELHKLELQLPDGTSYSIDLDEKRGTRLRVPPEAAQAMAAAMAPGLVKGAKVKPLAARTYLGRSCTGVEAEAMGTLSRTWTWKGIPLHSEASGAGGGKPIVVEVTKLAEGPVQPERFQVPPGVAIRDLSAR